MASSDAPLHQAPGDAAGVDTSCMLFVGAGSNYGPGQPEGAGGGRVHAYKPKAGAGWCSMERCSEFIIGGGCNAVEWVELHPSGRTLYAMCCYWNFKPVRASQLHIGQLVLFDIDASTGEMSKSMMCASGGHQPCHGKVSPDGSVLAVPHYLCGTTALWKLVPETGALVKTAPILVPLPSDAPQDVERLLGTHTGPLAHGVCFSGCGRWLLVCDAGQNQIVVYRMFGAAAEFTSVAPMDAQRPRHCIFSHGNLLVLSESQNVVTAHTFNFESGTVDATLVASTSTLASTDPGSDGNSFQDLISKTKRPASGGVWQAASELVALPGGIVVATNRAIASKAKLAVGDASIHLMDSQTLRTVSHLKAGVLAPLGDARQCVVVPDSSGGGLLVGLQFSEQVLYFAPTKDGLSSEPSVISKVECPLAVAVWPPEQERTRARL